MFYIYIYVCIRIYIYVYLYLILSWFICPAHWLLFSGYDIIKYSADVQQSRKEIGAIYMGYIQFLNDITLYVLNDITLYEIYYLSE